MINSIVNEEYEEFYEDMERYDWIYFNYFYDLDGGTLTTYQCETPVSSKQEAIGIIENGGYDRDSDTYCYSRVYTKRGT